MKSLDSRGHTAVCKLGDLEFGFRACMLDAGPSAVFRTLEDLVQPVDCEFAEGFLNKAVDMCTWHAGGNGNLCNFGFDCKHMVLFGSSSLQGQNHMDGGTAFSLDVCKSDLGHGLAPIGNGSDLFTES
ncbi:unnamed protein product [Effrenium voratum]|uniref:Uncharacterized protein n=1 Tax=Effrenium voratum TaxID=2562239 RepID=A0AA36IB88_9DINO|nr:unnamed protein product [Effrenium voratum]